MVTRKNLSLLTCSAILVGAGLIASGCSDSGGGGSKACSADINGQISAFSDAGASLTKVAGEVKGKAVLACAAIADASDEDYGKIDIKDPTKVSDEDLKKICAAAKVGLDAEVKAGLKITVTPGECHVNASAQLDCEAKCSASADCDPGTVEARCEPGELSVACEGSCEGTASCEATADVAVKCEGTCSATCEGTCKGTCSAEVENTDGSTSCAGKCEGTCEGTCSASCEMSADAKVECEGEVRCQGECKGTAKAPRCEAKLEPPSCEAAADCSGGCEGQASLEAECTPPSVVVTGVADAKIEAYAEAFTNLQGILDMKAQLVEGASAVATATAGLTGLVEGSAVCAASVAGDITATATATAKASASVSVSVEASADVSASGSAK